MIPRIAFSLIAALSALLMSSSPRAQGVHILAPETDMILQQHSVRVIVAGQVNAEVILSVNGEERARGRVLLEGTCNFGEVALRSGPNVLSIRHVDFRGEVSYDSTRVHVLGPPAELKLTLDRRRLPADSMSVSVATVEVFDGWGVRIPKGRIVTFSAELGRVLSEDADPERPGVQVRVRDGQALATIRSGAETGAGTVTATCESAETKVGIEYTASQRRLTVVGLGTGLWGLRTVGGRAGGSVFEEGEYTDGRIALFAEGAVYRDWTVRTSYDSDRRYVDRVFRELTPDRLYPIYGDASSIFYRAPVSSRLFVRLERDNAYLLYGDYATALSSSELLAYRRTLTGMKAFMRHEKGEVIGFGARNDRRIVVDELEGMGISGYYFLSRSSLVERSEQVRIQVRDRYHPERVLREERKFRYTDYEIDYEAGSLLFKAPVPARDMGDNPVFIVVSYETRTPGEKTYTGGLRARVRPIDALEIGGLFVEEERSPENYQLWGVDGVAHPFEGTTVSGEIASSSSAIGEDRAWKTEIESQIRPNTFFEGYYRKVGRGFENPSSFTARPGTEKYRADLRWRPGERTEIGAEQYWTKNGTTNEEERSASVAAMYRRGKLRSRAELERFSNKRNGRSEVSTIGTVGLTGDATDRLALSATRRQNFGGKNLRYKPTSTTVGAEVRITREVSVFARHEMFKDSPLDSARTTMGITSQVGETFTAYSKYEISGAISGEANRASIGLRNRLRLHPAVTANWSYERAAASSGHGAGDFWAYSLGLEFLPDDPWKASARYERRWARTSRRHVGTFGAALRLGPELSLILKDRLYVERSRRGEDRVDNRGLMGVAYRPVSHEHLNLLGKFEHRYEKRKEAESRESSRLALVSVEAVYHPARRWEVFARYAAKFAEELARGSIWSAFTDLWMTRGTYDLTDRFDVAVEYRLLAQRETRDVKNGWAAELGATILRNVRLAGGYNFSGYEDRDFSEGDYWAKGPYVKVQTKFTEHDAVRAIRLVR